MTTQATLHFIQVNYSDQLQPSSQTSQIEAQNDVISSQSQAEEIMSA